MAYTLYDKTMGTETKTSETFWSLDYDSTHDYDLVGVTSLGVAVRWIHRHGKKYDHQDCRIKCCSDKCDTWMAIDPKFIDNIRNYSCSDCMDKEVVYEIQSATEHNAQYSSAVRPMRAASY